MVHVAYLHDPSVKYFINEKAALTCETYFINEKVAYYVYVSDGSVDKMTTCLLSTKC